ncbi:MAG: CSLREA domain-containing protein, partial [Thermoanaerobaculia bacterium]
MANFRSKLFSLTGLFLLCAFTSQSPIRALDWTVDITADENDPGCAPGDCSLREAIAAAGDGDSILFALPGASPWTITLTGALQQLSVVNDITIVGPGASQLAVSGANLIRVMTVQVGASVSLSGLTVRNGEAKASGDKHGGCLKVLGEAVVSASRFESCQAWNGGVSSNTPGGDGGGVFVAAGGVFSGNLLVFVADVAGVGGGALSPPTVFAGGRGGALANAGSATLQRSTVSGCTAGAGGGPFGPGGEGGGIANLAGGVLRLESSTLSGNRSGDGATFMGSSGADG